MGRLFGTDGVRGRANADLTPELALSVAVAAAQVLLERDRSHAPVAVVGRDPRASGEMLEGAVVAGLTSAGANVVRVGVLPTPAVAYLTGALGADVGVMLSASHNPMPDNGIKLFAAGGHKLPDDVEDAIEAHIAEGLTAPRPTGARIGRVRDDASGADTYIQHLLNSTGHKLDGLKVVVDCAHGAASVASPKALRAAGAEVVVIGAEPDGLNINDGCGSTHLEVLQAAVREHAADVGFALDGDADRCLAVDHEGNVVDGDQILAVLALAMRDAGTLKADTVVATVMSNLGFVQAMRAQGVGVRQTKVGDRYVHEAMKASGYTLGGEQSGHVIMSGHATTGDGILTALHVLARMAERRQSLQELAGVMTRLPQVLVNVPDVDKSRTDDDAVVAAAVAEAEFELGDGGRVLLRPSGTEPLVRVMVEAGTPERASAVAHRLADVVRAQLSL